MNRSRRELVMGMGAALAAAGLQTGSHAAEPFPAQLIRLVVPFTPGGAADLLARPVAEGMSKVLGQTVLPDYVPGGNGVIGASAVMRAPANGYTLFLGSIGFNVLQPLTGQLENFDPGKVLAPITQLAGFRSLLVANPDSPIRSAADVIAQAKSAKGLTYGTAGKNSLHLTIEVLKTEGELNLVNIPYKGEMPAMQDVIGGQVDLAAVSEMASMPLIRSGRLRPVMGLDKQRLPSMPDVASVSELVPGVGLDAWFGLYARAGTPTPILDQIAKAVQTACAEEALSRNLTERGYFLKPSADRQAFVKMMQEEVARWESQLRKAKLFKVAT